MDKKLVVATFYAKPGSKEVLREWILKTATASRKELGVEKYLINVIDEALGHFLLVGLYSSDDAFNDHVNSVHVQNFLSAVPDLVEDNITYIATPFVNSADPKSIIESTWQPDVWKDFSKMSRRLLSIERHQKIVEKVSVEEAIDFITLAKELNVSVMTVRRDIRELEKQGYLKLTRGGAYAQITRSIDILLSPRAEDQGEAKTIIGKYAASLIEPGEVIFIGAGSTTAQFVQYLKPDLNLTVITASIPHATFLAAKGFKVISTGGEIATDDIAQTGYIAHDNIKRFFASKTIIGTRGVAKDVGITDINSEIAQMSSLMVAQAEQVLVLADISKVGVKANYAICPLSDIDEIITTKDAEQAYLAECGDQCEVLVSE